MTNGIAAKVYPDCFPANIEDLIRQDGAGENEFTYFRICRSGLIDRDAFLSTIEENLKSDSGVPNRDLHNASSGRVDIGVYSTSGYEKKKDAERLLRCMRKRFDGPVLIVGKTMPSCGLSMRTRESKTRRARGSHIDWWIYKDAHPEVFFEKV